MSNDAYRAAQKYQQASQAQQRAILSSQNSLVRWLENIGLHTLAELIKDWLKSELWPTIRDFFVSLVSPTG